MGIDRSRHVSIGYRETMIERTAGDLLNRKKTICYVYYSAYPDAETIRVFPLFDGRKIGNATKLIDRYLTAWMFSAFEVISGQVYPTYSIYFASSCSIIVE